MRLRHLVSLLVLLGCVFAQSAAALEINYWPLFNGERASQEEGFQRWQGLGPFFFGQTSEDLDVYGVRPFWVRFEEIERKRNSVHVLYPIFSFRSNPQGVSWDIFNSVRYSSFAGETSGTSRTIHLFPFLFLRLDPERPQREYFGIFPVAGQVQDQFGFDRITWFFFPFSTRFERGKATTIGMPWPFIRFTHGEGASGHHLWPLYGYEFRAGRSEHRYWLWPLGYQIRKDLWKETPFEAWGFLPFYAWSTSEEAVSRSFVWPFFGYTDSFAPEYFEKRYFWPLLVQRRGDTYINRWAPVYSHTIRMGVDKTWAMWPIYRHEKKMERDLFHQKTQVLYFLYWNLRQSDPEKPEAPPAIKRHLWPLFSYWDNGAGHKQLQVISPLEVFFPQNDAIRALYTPLFALYRRDHQEGVETRDSLLFDFITWTRGEDFSRVHVGVLGTFKKQPEGRQWEILKGLVGYDSTSRGSKFRFLWFPRDQADEEEVE